MYNCFHITGRKIGFIAQEVKDIVPEAVNITKGFIGDTEVDDLHGLNTTALVPVLVEAIQELKAKNDALEARIAALEN